MFLQNRDEFRQDPDSGVTTTGNARVSSGGQDVQFDRDCALFGGPEARERPAVGFVDARESLVEYPGDPVLPVTLFESRGEIFGGAGATNLFVKAGREYDRASRLVPFLDELVERAKDADQRVLAVGRAALYP